MESKGFKDKKINYSLAGSFIGIVIAIFLVIIFRKSEVIGYYSNFLTNFLIGGAPYYMKDSTITLIGSGYFILIITLIFYSFGYLYDWSKRKLGENFKKYLIVLMTAWFILLIIPLLLNLYWTINSNNEFSRLEKNLLNFTEEFAQIPYLERADCVSDKIFCTFFDISDKQKHASMNFLIRLNMDPANKVAIMTDIKNKINKGDYQISTDYYQILNNNSYQIEYIATDKKTAIKFYFYDAILIVDAKSLY